MSTGMAGCCAWAVAGHDGAAPPSSDEAAPF
jgi:hypothetical protein